MDLHGGDVDDYGAGSECPGCRSFGEPHRTSCPDYVRPPRPPPIIACLAPDKPRKPRAKK